jgi:hypothetical protein
MDTKDKLSTSSHGLLVFVKEYLWIEVLLPLAPILTEFLMKAGFPNLGQFNLFEKPLAISAMMVPLVSFIKAPPERKTVRFFFGASIFWGLALFVLSIVISSPAWVGNPSSAVDLERCYKFAAGGLLFALIVGSLNSLWKNSLAHWWRNPSGKPAGEQPGSA